MAYFWGTATKKEKTLTNTWYNTPDKKNSRFIHKKISRKQQSIFSLPQQKIVNPPRAPKVPGHASPSPKDGATWTWFISIQQNRSAVGKKSAAGICLFMPFLIFLTSLYAISHTLFPGVFLHMVVFWEKPPWENFEGTWFAMGTKEKWTMLPPDSKAGLQVASKRHKHQALPAGVGEDYQVGKQVETNIS